MRKQKPVIAELIFKANTMMYPHSANVYDSYAEALAMNGNLKASVANYQKVVDIAKDNEDPQLELYMENLEKTKKRLKKKG